MGDAADFVRRLNHLLVLSIEKLRLGQQDQDPLGRRAERNGYFRITFGGGELVLLHFRLAEVDKGRSNVIVS
jgi:hypothetical protein